jgi:predicted phage terminase large subunit-like protein
MNFAATLAAVRAMSVRWPRIIKKLIEDKANGTAIIETLCKELPGIEAVNPEGGKVARANAISGLFEGHNIFFPWPGDPENAWVTALEDELLAFPVGVHDDRVDALTQALNFMYQRKSRLKEAMAKVHGGMLIGTLA